MGAIYRDGGGGGGGGGGSSASTTTGTAAAAAAAQAAQAAGGSADAAGGLRELYLAEKARADKLQEELTATENSWGRWQAELLKTQLIDLSTMDSLDLVSGISPNPKLHYVILYSQTPSLALSSLA